MEDGRTKEILDKLLDSVENGQSVPLAPGKVMVNRDETIRLLRELAATMESELKVYRDITDRKGKVLTEARQEAERIVSEAEQSASRIRVSKRISAGGQVINENRLDAKEREALRTAGDIYAASLIYTDEMLTEVNDVVGNAVSLISDRYREMMETLAEKARLIEQNKAELMGSLKELSKEDRYAQILELSQLLSNELYRERMKLFEAEKKQFSAPRRPVPAEKKAVGTEMIPAIKTEKKEEDK